MKRWIAILAFVLLPAALQAQTTSVSGTITDAGGVVWKNGTYTFTFTPSPNNPTASYFQNGVPFNKFTTISGSLDATGSLTSVAIPDNLTITPSGSTWATKVCSASTASNGCFTIQLTITGASQSITSTVIPPAIILDLTNPPPGGAAAYTDGEIIGARVGSQYFNLTDSTIHVCTFPLCTWVAVGAASSPVVPGGTSIQAQFNNGGSFGGSPCISLNNLLTGSINQDCNTGFKGPNPWLDITRFGARQCVINSTPCAVGITASITSGTNTATLSAASTFVGGDGVVIYGAGTASGLSTPAAPTITNVLAQMGTGTDLTVTGASGATTKCYKIIARTTLGGYTPASPETCTTTGQSTLGVVTVNLSSCTRALTTVTCVTSSPHPVLIGGPGGSYGQAEVYIGSTTPGTVIDPSFRGWRSVLSAADSTHFTFADTVNSTANGATTTCSGCGSGGTATFFTANHVSWTAVSNAWLYYIYGGASGAETLIGVSRPQNIFGSTTYTTWDDFTNLQQSWPFPPWIPTTPPSVGANNNLSTTITAGAGTTSITLATNAGATVTNNTIRLDATPGLIAAAAAAQQTGVVYIPADPTGAFRAFQVASYCDLTPYNVSIVQNGQMYMHETLALQGQNVRYSGKILPQSLGSSSFPTWGHEAKTTVAEAVPGLYLNQSNSNTIEGIDFIAEPSQPNGVLLALAESGFNEVFQDDAFSTASGSTDLMGFGLIIRGGTGLVFDRVLFQTGLSTDGGSHNTALYCNKCGEVSVRQAYSLHTGMIFNEAASASGVNIMADHYNGGFTPLVSIGTLGGILGLTLGNQGYPVSIDTVGHPCVSLFGSGVVQVYNNGCQPTGYTFVAPSVTGNVQAVINGNTLNGLFDNSMGQQLLVSNIAPSTTSFVYNVTGGTTAGGISVGYNADSIFVQGPPPTSPTCSVSAGGSIPLGTYNFTLVPVWWNSQMGTPSLASSNCTTTTGNQTITVNWSAVAGNPQGNRIFVNGVSASQLNTTFPPSTTSVVLTNLTGIGAPQVQPFPLSGPSLVLPNTQGIASPSYLVAAPLGSTTQTSVATAGRAAVWPDLAGTVPLNFISTGTNSVSGCALTVAVGGATGGKFASGTTGACTVTITLPTAPNGWTCGAHDLTTAADANNVVQTAFTTTTATMSGTTVSGDVITWNCTGW